MRLSLLVPVLFLAGCDLLADPEPACVDHCPLSEARGRVAAGETCVLDSIHWTMGEPAETFYRCCR